MEILNEKSKQEVEILNDKYRFGTLDEYDERRMFEGAATVVYTAAAFLIFILAISIAVIVKIF